MKRLRRLWFRLVPTYRRLELVYRPWWQADQMLKATANSPESERWRIAKEEDLNPVNTSHVFLERRERIIE